MEAQERLQQALLLHGVCGSETEAEVIASLILEGQQGSPQDDATLRQGLQEQLGLSETECEEIMGEMIQLGNDDVKETLSTTSTPDEPDNDDASSASASSSDKEESDYVGEGECELCERYIRLTKHHLIPKSTWHRIIPRLKRAAESSNASLEETLSHLLVTTSNKDDVSLSTTTKYWKNILNKQTCLICRACHSAIHRFHSNETLAIEFNTVERLLGDEKVFKYAKWASKQRVGKYAR